MSFPDADAARRHPAAIAALRCGDAAAALACVSGQTDAAASRVTGRALLALGDREGAQRALVAALADAADDPAAQALAHAALAAVARAMGEPTEAIGHLEWALGDAPAHARPALHREAATVASRAGLLDDAEFHARAALRTHGEHPSPGGESRSLGDGAMAEADDHLRLGAILSAQGRHDEAVDHLRQATATLTCEVGDAHADTLLARSELAEALALAGRTAQAIVEHEAVLTGRAAALGADHPELAPTLLALAALTAASGASPNQPRAHELARRAVDVLQGRVPANHPLLAEARAAATGWAA